MSRRAVPKANIAVRSTESSPVTQFDAVIVGSGINSLVCAAMLARRGKSVCVLEREQVLGGCIRTEALTEPGYLHDSLSAAHDRPSAAPSGLAVPPPRLATRGQAKSSRR